jgi:hypothetical protein
MAFAAAADDSPAVIAARANLESLREQVKAGLQPAVKLGEAQEAIDDALDAQVLDRTLYGHLEIEKLTPSEADEMVNAATRRVARAQKKMDYAAERIANGVAAVHFADDFKAELDRRETALSEARSRAELLIEIVEIARAETAAPAEKLTGIWKPREFVDGDHLLGPEEIRDITLSFEKQFHQPLPVSARGMTEVHRALGFDHTGRIDVAVTPDSAEGQWLRKFLESKNIPYYAFRVAIPGKATGAHIHIGPGSTRLHTTD